VNVNLLIDAIVRQTTVLIAQLATAAGSRAQLAQTANQVFLDLVRELKDQGLGNEVIADMFGLTLRTYHNKIARLAESATDRGRSLWEALLAYIQERGPVRRADVLSRFSGNDEATLRGVLKDLVDSGMIFRAGRGDHTTYRAASPEDVAVVSGAADERMANFAWVAIHRYGPITRAELAEHVPAGDDAIDAALAKLLRDGRVGSAESAGRILYSSTECADFCRRHEIARSRCASASKRTTKDTPLPRARPARHRLRGANPSISARRGGGLLLSEGRHRCRKRRGTAPRTALHSACRASPRRLRRPLSRLFENFRNNRRRVLSHEACGVRCGWVCSSVSRLLPVAATRGLPSPPWTAHRQRRCRCVRCASTRTALDTSSAKGN
jgi:hypothetical protein